MPNLRQYQAALQGVAVRCWRDSLWSSWSRRHCDVAECREVERWQCRAGDRTSLLTQCTAVVHLRSQQVQTYTRHQKSALISGVELCRMLSLKTVLTAEDSFKTNLLAFTSRSSGTSFPQIFFGKCHSPKWYQDKGEQWYSSIPPSRLEKKCKVCG